MTKQMGQSNAEVSSLSGYWEPRILHNGKWLGFYDGEGKEFETEQAAWDCARRCYPDTEHLSAMVQVVFVPRVTEIT